MGHGKQLDHASRGEGVPAHEFGQEADTQAELDGSEHGAEIGDDELQVGREGTTRGD